MLFLPLLLAMCCGERAAPRYTAASVVHALTGEAVLVPDTFASIYGEELAFATAQLRAADVQGGLLPVQLPGTGVTVSVGGVAVPVWYVSPTQINFLVPSFVVPRTEVEVWLIVDGRAGPVVRLRVQEAAPALFPYDRDTALLMDAAGQVRTRQNPVEAGSDVILLATGLGGFVKETAFRQLPTGPAELLRRAEFRILLNGEPVSDGLIRYAGAAPTLAGVTQINLKLPEGLGAMPPIQLAMGARLSPVLTLPVR
ncbi:MAG: hypothetical protein JNK87_35370 [Bryobacterales bacterium]|nr:hypothetical protein [Bryobacterales bacterium]